jgi:hypothetical protein
MQLVRHLFFLLPVYFLMFIQIYYNSLSSRLSAAQINSLLHFLPPVSRPREREKETAMRRKKKRIRRE